VRDPGAGVDDEEPSPWSALSPTLSLALRNAQGMHRIYLWARDVAFNPSSPTRASSAWC
jgi:hypothetical protein